MQDLFYKMISEEMEQYPNIEWGYSPNKKILVIGDIEKDPNYLQFEIDDISNIKEIVKKGVESYKLIYDIND